MIERKKAKLTKLFEKKKNEANDENSFEKTKNRIVNQDEEITRKFESEENENTSENFET